MLLKSVFTFPVLLIWCFDCLLLNFPPFILSEKKRLNKPLLNLLIFVNTDNNKKPSYYSFIFNIQAHLESHPWEIMWYILNCNPWLTTYTDLIPLLSRGASVLALKYNQPTTTESVNQKLSFSKELPLFFTSREKKKIIPPFHIFQFFLLA